MPTRPDPDAAYVARVAPFALAMPEAYEEDAWNGVRWRIRQRTFAHVVGMRWDDAARLFGAGPDDVVSVLNFRSRGEELAALLAAGLPFLSGWGDDVVRMVLDDETDWAEVAELVAESYRVLAPQRLVRQLDERPGAMPPLLD